MDKPQKSSRLTIKANYLSFFDKKDLTNGIDGFILCAMNANEISPNPHNRRLKRIKNASLIFQCFVGVSLLFGVYWMLAFLFGWPFFSQDKIRIVISHSHIYTSPAEMPAAIFALWLVKAGLGIASAVVLFALFQLYGRGILFSARNVRFIRFFGY